METKLKWQMAEPIRGFRLPRYAEIPTVGLYLEQTIKYINGFLAPLGCLELTGSMVSNYVKKGLISNAVKKQYNREQIAQLIFITIAKLALSIDNLGIMLGIQKSTYETSVAYEYMRLELVNMLEYVFGRKEEPDKVGVENTEQKHLLRKAVTAVAHKMYLEKYMSVLTEECGKEP